MNNLIKLKIKLFLSLILICFLIYGLYITFLIETNNINQHKNSYEFIDKFREDISEFELNNKPKYTNKLCNYVGISATFECYNYFKERDKLISLNYKISNSDYKKFLGDNLNIKGKMESINPNDIIYTMNEAGSFIAKAKEVEDNCINIDQDNYDTNFCGKIISELEELRTEEIKKNKEKLNKYKNIDLYNTILNYFKAKNYVLKHWND